MKLSLEMHRPANSTKVTCRQSGAYVFLYTTNKGEPGAKGFTKSAKSRCNFWIRFNTEARREEYIRNFFAGQLARAERNKADRAARSKPHTLQLGHVFYTSWGYDQTNVEFFQVTRIVGKNTVEVREISALREETGISYGLTSPKIDAFKGDPLTRRVSTGNRVSIRIDSCSSAWLWDGKPVSYSWGH